MSRSIRRPNARRQSGGFTLAELMVVVAIVGILAAVAIMSVKKTSYGASVNHYANKIVSLMDMARMRATSTRRWHRIEVLAGEINLWQGRTVGQAKPVAWDLVTRSFMRGDVLVFAMDNTVHISVNVNQPAAGAGLPGSIDFSPEGGGQAATVFVGEKSDKHRSRVVVYGATGTAYVFAEW